MRHAAMALALAAMAAGCERPVAQKKADDAPAVVRKAECRRATGGIRVNGVLDEAAWEGAQEIKDFAVFWEKRKPATATTARLLWDDRYLYFAAEMDDADLFALVEERNGRTWEDDVFELFFKPKADSPMYYEIQVNARNTPLELYLPSRGAGGYRRFAGQVKFGMATAVRLRGTLNRYDDRDKGWTVEGSIPWTAFRPSGGRPAAGDKWKFALCRYDYSVALEKVELSSTAPLALPDFHRYEDYGELEFIGEKE